jgi:hypothetical protein
MILKDSSKNKLPSIETSPIKTSEFKRPSVDMTYQNNLSSSRHSSISMANLTNSGKSSADSRSKYLDEAAINNNKQAKNSTTTAANPLSLLSSMSQTNNSGGDPIQLFKKINQLSSLKNTNSGNQQQQNKSGSLVGSSNVDNKKRISLLLSRKS